MVPAVQRPALGLEEGWWRRAEASMPTLSFLSTPHIHKCVLHQASSRGEAKDSALLSSRDAGLLEPPERVWFLIPISEPNLAGLQVVMPRDAAELSGCTDGESGEGHSH